MFSWNLARSTETLSSRWAIKSFCNFLLKKKLWKFILGDIDPNQLDVQLSAGTIQLSNLALNVDYLNQKDMGCFVSMPQETGGNKRQPGNIGKVSVFVLGFRIPKPVDFSLVLGDHLSKTLVECLSVLRTRIVIMAGQEAPTITRTRRKVATQHGSRRLFACSFGTSYNGSTLQHKVQFIWVNQEDDADVKLEICFPFCFLFMLTVLFVFSTMRENYIIFQNILGTAMFSAWCEVLSILHLMATLSLSRAKLLFLPRTSLDGYSPKVSEGVRFSLLFRRNLPVDLAEGVLRALCLQALGQLSDAASRPISPMDARRPCDDSDPNDSC